jgi:hypothetical protein
LIQDDPEVALALSMFADRLREKGKEALAFKIENLIELLIEELEAPKKKKP